MNNPQLFFTQFVILLLHLLDSCNATPSEKAFKDLKESPQTGQTDLKVLVNILKTLNKPTTMERNPMKLKRKLGPKFDPFFMSISEPDSLKHRHQKQHHIMMDGYDESPKMRSLPAMGNKLRHMKFFLRKDNGKRKEMGKKVTQKFQRWLWNLSRCPVRYRWIDAGENMFPRFIKTGSCSKKKTCSFPSGMKCIISDWKSVEVLLYACSGTEHNSVTSSCDWRPFKVDILTSCKCGCQK